MAEFSRIRVTPAEEEDVVIMAGAVEGPLPAESEEARAPLGQAAPEEPFAPTEEAPAVSSKRADAYRETSLEDLQRTRMSGMQKAIIALAIVAVAAFIIWYVLLH